MEGGREGREDGGTGQERRRYGILDGDEAGVLPVASRAGGEAMDDGLGHAMTGRCCRSTEVLFDAY
jgi:hypothetical protein